MSPHQPPVLIEVLVDSPAAAVAAEQGGADRLEVCQNLFEGGTTPSAGVLAALRRHTRLPWNVMIRPRGGDFCYTDTEFEVMCEDILVARQSGAAGVVLGILTPEGRIDRDRTARLIEQARPLKVTFHRAFDMVDDPAAALESLVALGVDRILTSGLEATALEGASTLRALVEQAGDRIIILPGGGIREHNVERILRETGACEIHVSGSTTVHSRMTHRNARVFMGRELRAPEFSWSTVDPDRIRAYRARVTPPQG